MRPSDTLAKNSLVLTTNGNGRAATTPQQPMPLSERKNRLAETEATVTLAKDSADILLNREGSLLQTLLLEESVRATSAQVKDDLRNLLVDGPKRFRESLPFGAGSFLPPLPFEDQLTPFVGKTVEEIRAQQLAAKLLSLVSQQQLDRMRNGVADSGDDSATGSPIPPPALRALVSDVEPEQLAILSRELRESAPKYVPLVGLLGAKFTKALLETASNNIDAAISDSEREGQSGGLTQATARGLSNIARRSAITISEQIVNTPTGDR